MIHTVKETHKLASKNGSPLVTLVILFAIIMPLLTGCWSRIELEEQAFVPIMGIDKGPSNTVIVTARVIVPSALGSPGGGGGGGGGEKPTKLVSTQGRNIGEAFSLLSQTVDREPSFSHCTAVVFGEDVAKDDIMKYIRPLAQFREFRRTMFIYTTKGTAAEVFKNNKPIIEKSPTRYVESMMKTADRTGLIARVQLHDFLVANETPHQDPIMVMMGTNPKVKKDAKKEEKETKQSGAASSTLPVFGDNSKKVPDTAGKIKRKGGNPLEPIGTALFKEGKLVGELDGEETQLLQMVRGTYKRGVLTFNDPLQKESYVALTVTPARQPKVDVVMIPDSMHPQITIDLNLEGDLFGVQSNSDFTVEKARKRLEKEVESEVRNNLSNLIDMLRHDLKVDPMAISNQTRSAFLYEDAFKKYDWRTAFDQSHVNCHVVFKLRRIGIQGEPPGVTQR